MLIADFPIYDAPNYAPAKPLLELVTPTEGKQDDVTSQIRALYEELNKRDSDYFEASAENAYIIAAFTQGQQTFEQNWNRGGGWELVQPSAATNPNLTRSFNKMQFQISQALEDLVSSNPDFEPADMFKAWDYAKKVKAGKIVWNHYERQFYTARFNIDQAHSLLTTGTAIEELVYDTSIKGVKVLREIWGSQTIQTYEGGGECFDCGFVGPYEAFNQWETSDQRKDFEGRSPEEQQAIPYALVPQCSQCGSTNTSVDDPQFEEMPTIQSAEQFQLGDFTCRNRPLQSCRFDITKAPEDSSYFITNQYFPLRKIKYIFGRDIQISSSQNDVCLDYLEKMARIGARSAGLRIDPGSYHKTSDAILNVMSLSPEELCEIEIPRRGDNLTVSGKELPEGKTFADLFPEGGTILGFNGMQNVYGIYPTHHSKTISSAVYFSRPNSGTGRGMDDLKEIQKRVNKLDRQQSVAVDGASPGYAFIEGSVDEKHVKKMGWPNAKIPVSSKFFAEVPDINRAIRQFEPQQVAPQFFAYQNELEKMLQMTAHNVSMGGAVYDANNDTATGAQILEAKAQAITIPMVQSKAGARKGTIKNLLTGYSTVFAGATRTFGSTTGRKHYTQMEIKGEDVDPQIEFVVVENSPIPQNFYLRKMDYLSFGAAVAQFAPQGGWAQLRETDPELANILSRAFNVDVGDDEDEAITEICKMRMTQAFEVLPAMDAMLSAQVPNAPSLTPLPEPSTMFEDDAAGGEAMMPPQPTDEGMLMELLFSSIFPRIVPKEKNHMAKADWFRNFADTPDGLKLDEMQRTVVFEFVLQHERAEQLAAATDAANMALDSVVAQAPAQAIQAKGEQMMAVASAPPPMEMPPDESGEVAAVTG